MSSSPSAASTSSSSSSPSPSPSPSSSSEAEAGRRAWPHWEGKRPRSSSHPRKWGSTRPRTSIARMVSLSLSRSRCRPLSELYSQSPASAKLPIKRKQQQQQQQQTTPPSSPGSAECQPHWTHFWTQDEDASFAAPQSFTWLPASPTKRLKSLTRSGIKAGRAADYTAHAQAVAHDPPLQNGCASPPSTDIWFVQQQLLAASAESWSLWNDPAAPVAASQGLATATEEDAVTSCQILDLGLQQYFQEQQQQRPRVRRQLQFDDGQEEATIVEAPEAQVPVSKAFDLNAAPTPERKARKKFTPKVVKEPKARAKKVGRGPGRPRKQPLEQAQAQSQSQSQAQASQEWEAGMERIVKFATRKKPGRKKKEVRESGDDAAIWPYPAAKHLHDCGCVDCLRRREWTSIIARAKQYQDGAYSSSTVEQQASRSMEHTCADSGAGNCQVAPLAVREVMAEATDGELACRMEHMQISGRVEEEGDNRLAIVPHNAQQGMVVYDDPSNLFKKKKRRAKVVLDKDTLRCWNLLMGKRQPEAIDEDGGSSTKWEEERSSMKRKVNRFLDIMHQIQGDHTFCAWKGSVVDSVVGAFLTQNVSDQLSSSAFMALGARFPIGGCSRVGDEAPKPLNSMDPSVLTPCVLSSVCDVVNEDGGHASTEVHITSHVGVDAGNDDSNDDSTTRMDQDCGSLSVDGRSDSVVIDESCGGRDLCQAEANADECNYPPVADGVQHDSCCNLSSGDSSGGATCEEVSIATTQMCRLLQEADDGFQEPQHLVQALATVPCLMEQMPELDGLPESRRFGTDLLVLDELHMRSNSETDQNGLTLPPNVQMQNPTGCQQMGFTKEQKMELHYQIETYRRIEARFKAQMTKSANVQSCHQVGDGGECRYSPTRDCHDTAGGAELEPTGSALVIDLNNEAPPSVCCSSGWEGSISAALDGFCVAGRDLGGAASVSFGSTSSSIVSADAALDQQQLRRNALGRSGDIVEAGIPTPCEVSQDQAAKDVMVDVPCEYVASISPNGRPTTSQVSSVVEGRAGGGPAVLKDADSSVNNGKRKPRKGYTHLTGLERAQMEVEQGQGGHKSKTDWELLRTKVVAEDAEKDEARPPSVDAVDWEAVRLAKLDDIAAVIKERGMNYMLAGRIRAFLERMHTEHGSIDLEWLRDIPSDSAKEFLLGVRGLGLKSVECIRLLTLHQLAFPVDTNVGRICVRLGWVPLEPLPEELQLHLLELYPVQATIQQYLWPRLCTLDQRTLYELHYQMITFGKVFCTKSKPNCIACPMSGDCQHHASSASAKLLLKGPEGEFNQQETARLQWTGTEAEAESSRHYMNAPALALEGPKMDEWKRHRCEPIIEEPSTPEPAETICSDIEDWGICPEEVVLDGQPMTGLLQENDLSKLVDHVEKMIGYCQRSCTVENPPADSGIVRTYVRRKHSENSEKCESAASASSQTQPNGTAEDVSQHQDTDVGCISDQSIKSSSEAEMHSSCSRELVVISPEIASRPPVQLKRYGRLRTVHNVYELPDDHPLLKEVEVEPRDEHDPYNYLLAIWGPEEGSQFLGGSLGRENTFSSLQNESMDADTVKCTLLIPCRTALKGTFPLNGTYFQKNEVFADHKSSLVPLFVSRQLLWNLRRRLVYFGTTATNIYRNLSTEEIQRCGWAACVCVRGFERNTRAPKPLVARLHFPPSKVQAQKRATKKDLTSKSSASGNTTAS